MIADCFSNRVKFAGPEMGGVRFPGNVFDLWAVTQYFRLPMQADY